MGRQKTKSRLFFIRKRDLNSKDQAYCICVRASKLSNNVAKFLIHAMKYYFSTVVWSSLGHPLGSTQKVPCRRRCLTGSPFIHCKLAKWEQPKGALQAKVPYRGGALQGHDHCTTTTSATTVTTYQQCYQLPVTGYHGYWLLATPDTTGYRWKHATNRDQSKLSGCDALVLTEIGSDDITRGITWLPRENDQTGLYTVLRDAIICKWQGRSLFKRLLAHLSH